MRLNDHYSRWSCPSGVGLSEKPHMNISISELRPQVKFLFNILQKKSCRNDFLGMPRVGPLRTIYHIEMCLKQISRAIQQKKTAWQSEQNSLQAWPMFTCTKTQKSANRKGGELQCLLSRPHMYFSALSLLHGRGSWILTSNYTISLCVNLTWIYKNSRCLPTHHQRRRRRPRRR